VRDPTIAMKFNTYRFADFKEKEIVLLSRVTRVSVWWLEVVRGMKKAGRTEKKPQQSSLRQT